VRAFPIRLPHELIGERWKTLSERSVLLAHVHNNTTVPGLSSHAVSGMAGGPEHTIPLRIFADGVGHTKTPDAYTYGRPISFTTVASGVQFETILTIVKADPCHT
jgi:hypothetical protein